MSPTNGGLDQTGFGAISQSQKAQIFYLKFVREGKTEVKDASNTPAPPSSTGMLLRRGKRSFRCPW